MGHESLIISGSRDPRMNDSRRASASRKFTILHADDDGYVIKSSSRILTGAGYEFKSANSGSDALQIFKAGGIDLVISDINLKSDMNGLQLLQALKAADPDVKVIMLCGGVGLEAGRELRKEGAAAILDKPFNSNVLIAVVKAALEKTVWMAQEPQDEGIMNTAEKVARVIVVDDDADCVETVGMALEAMGYSVWTATEAGGALIRYAALGADIVISDFHMPSMSGLELLNALKAYNPDVKVIIMSGNVGDEERNALRDAGALMMLRKPAAMEALRAAIEKALGS